MNTLISAPEGFRCLRKGVTYVLVRNRPDESAVIVEFDDKCPGARLVYLSREDFLHGLATRKISIEKEAFDLPPWLQDLKGRNLDCEDGYVVHEAKNGLTARDSTVVRVGFLSEALERVNEILSDPEADRALNRLARQCKPAQNETRFRCWFYTYIACGRNLWSLLPNWKGGDWDRNAAKYAGKKFGRHGPSGREHGHACTKPMAELLVQGFKKHVKVGATLNEVYIKTVTKQFGCRTTEVSRGKGKSMRPVFVHPKGEPFPTYWQFRYHCEKHIGREEMRRARMGDQKYRNKVAPFEGSYSQDLAMLVERVHVDASLSKDFPSSYVEPGVSMEKRLCTVKLVCALSGMTTGVGFSVGSENSDAYNAALFCMAIRKSKFGQIIGYPITDADWPGEGLPASIIADGGPGASAGINLPDAIGRGKTPSFTPQSNATVESKHPRSQHTTGAPTHIVSSLNPIQMARREVQRAIGQNKYSDATARTSIDMKLQGITTPLEFWNYMDQGANNDCMRIPFEEAVRRFLKPVKFQVSKGQLTLHGEVYSSEDFKRTEQFQNLRSFEGTLDGYVLEIAVRTAWVVADGRIVEVSIRMPFRAPSRDIYLSLDELSQLERQSATDNHGRKEMKRAGDAHARQRFQEATGMSWDAGRVRAGRAPRAAKGIKRMAGAK